MALAKIVVVEDERVVALHLRQQLARLGYEVPAMATKGRQALQLIATHRPDVVLMDIHIEGDLDGIDTARQIPSHLRIPVIYLTAYSEDATLERARNTKPYGYLLKPFSERELHATIQMALERHRADTVLTSRALDLTATVASQSEELVLAGQALEKQTERSRRAEQALRQAQKMEAIGQLTGGLAHDFNNLMQVVVGNLEIVNRVAPDEAPKLRHAADHALQAAKKAVTVTQRLLAFASIQPLAPKPIDVNGLVGGMTQLLHRALEERVDIRTVFGNDLWLVEVDPNQLESTLLNLAVNARDAIAGSGSLTIETSNMALESEWAGPAEIISGDYVRVSVTDTGCGMNAATAARAFDPFFTTKDVGKGTGLGLSQVYGFVKQSGGYIKLDSETGLGTCVTIYLPRFDGAAVEEPAVPRNGDVPISGSETILIVEDDDDVREFSVDLLTELGYRVLQAADGPTAMRLLQAPGNHVDLLFTDIVLPGGMHGGEIAERARFTQPTLAVLFTSGYDRNAITKHGRLDEGVELLPKPFSYTDLSARIRTVLDKQARAGIEPAAANA